MFDSDYRLPFLAILNPAETYDVADKILTAAGGVIPIDAATLERKQFVTLGELNGVLATALGIGTTADPHTEAKAAADRLRDSGFVRIKNTVNDILSDPDEDQALRDAAATVKTVLADYPVNLHSTNQAENTALLNTLIPKLREEPALSAIAALGLTRFVDRMHDGNEQFKTASAASTEDRAADAPQDWAAAKPVRWHGSQFASNLAYLGETEEAFAPLAAQVRQIIDDAEAVARARKTRRESDSPEEQP